MQINQLNLISVAYVGDAVFSLFVRDRLIRKFDCKSGRLHALSKDYVAAAKQSRILESILDKLTSQEIDIVRRAKNAHISSRAKNADISDYRRATALEGLIGFLYLTEQKERLSEVLELCARFVENEQ